MPRKETDMRKIVPEEFYRANKQTPSARTVGELIAVLQRLPANMQLNTGNTDTDEPTVFVCVYNIDDDAHARIEEDDLFSDFDEEDADMVAED